MEYWWDGIVTDEYQSVVKTSSTIATTVISMANSD